MAKAATNRKTAGRKADPVNANYKKEILKAAKKKPGISNVEMAGLLGITTLKTGQLANSLIHAGCPQRNPSRSPARPNLDRVRMINRLSNSSSH